jgi:hypothetical protein
MKAPSIQLSLAGDRRFICLTTSTVRNAYDQLASVNPGYSRKLRKSFNSNDHLLYSLLTCSYFTTLDRNDIREIESELNRQIIDNNLYLVENEGRLFDRSTNAVDVCKGSIPNCYIFRYGMKFMVEPLTKSRMFSMKNIDLFWQDRDFDFHYIRYCGLVSSPRQQQIKLRFCHPLDLLKTWTYTVAEFQPRQILMIQKIYPCKGFYLK